MRIPSTRWLAAPLCIAILAAPSIAAAEDTDIPGAPHLLPEDTLAYIRLDSADDFRTDMANSSLGQMLSDPKMKPFVGEVTQLVTDVFQIVGDQLGITLEELTSLPSGQVAAAIMPGNISERDEELIQDEAEGDDSTEAIRRRIAIKREQQNSFAVVFMIDAGEDLDKLMFLVARFEEAILRDGYVRRTSHIDDTTVIHLLPPRPGRPEIELFDREGVFVIGFGHHSAHKALEQWLDRSDEPTLADRVEFSSVMARCVGAEETRPQLTYFFDPYHTIERLIKRGGAAALVWPVMEDLGIGKIRGMGGSLFRAGEEFESISHFHMLVDPPRDGIFGVLRPETVEATPPSWVPDDVSTYTTCKWDFETTYKNLGKLIAKSQGADPEAVEAYLEQQVGQATGVSIQDDLIANIVGRYVMCTWLEPPVKLNSRTMGHALELNDPEAVKAVLEQLRQRFSKSFEVETIGQSVVYSAKIDLQQLPQAFRRPEYCLTILGNWAIISDSKTLMERFTLASRDAIPRLVNEPEYELIASELGAKLDGEEPFLLAFKRGADSIRQLYELVQSPDTRKFIQRGGDNPMIKRILDLLARNELPPFEEFEKHFAPSGSFGYDEPSGMHLGSFKLRAME